MTLNEYQDKAMTTCLVTCENTSYMLLNLVGEVGEFAGKLAKAIRKNDIVIRENDMMPVVVDHADETIADLKSEAGDILWQLSGLCRVMGWKLEDVAQANLDKLAARKKTDTIITHTDH